MREAQKQIEDGDTALETIHLRHWAGKRRFRITALRLLTLEDSRNLSHIEPKYAYHSVNIDLSGNTE